MNFSDPALWYMGDCARREADRRRNENILQRQLFQGAEARGIISIRQDGTVEVLDVGGAVGHFGHHPDLVNMNPVLGRALSGDYAKLGPALSEVWRQIEGFRG